MDPVSLPKDNANQIYATVKPIVAGNLDLPLNIVLQDSHDAPDSNTVHIPAYSFFIAHPTRGNVLFDLGIRKHGEGYPPALHHRIHDFFKTVCDEDVADQLGKGGVKPEDIHTIVLSHVHWDHIGDPGLFPEAELVMGAGSKGPLAERVYPRDPEGKIQELPHDMRVRFVDFHDPSQTHSAPFGPFPSAIDFFEDGSFYLVDTPGHMPGHLSAALRVAPDTFVFLTGDLCHHREAYDPGTRLISEKMYEDVAVARETVAKLVRLNAEMPNVVVILAHDPERVKEGMPLFPHDVRAWVEEEVVRAELLLVHHKSLS